MEQTAGPAVRQSILLQGRSCAVDSASVGYDSVIIPAPDISKSYDMIAASYVPGTVQLDRADISPNLLMTHSLSLYAYMVICPYELHEFCLFFPCVLLVAIAKKKKGPLSPDIFPILNICKVL